MSDDRQFAVVVIAFVGSVFSPRYRAARSRGTGVDPMDHCALNVAIYGNGGRLWAFSHWPRDQVERTSDHFTLGNSRLQGGPGEVTVLVDEHRVPSGRCLRGELCLRYEEQWHDSYLLDASAAHRWTPVVPRGRIHVEMEEPRLSFSGNGYHDMNDGDSPLESAFVKWNWARTTGDDGTRVLYDLHRRDGTTMSLGHHFGAGGRRELQLPDSRSLGRSLWGLKRTIRADQDAVRVLASCEDTPFYSRCLIEVDAQKHGQVGTHESLDLNRFRRSWVQALLPFRISYR